ncbi:MAG TPA: fibronectin type III domain-containing protein [Thermoanaerobaculia bacterium]|nr:fibronectin type III domain-containing protein [Thermoanaerobaculia bacterium]
MVLRHHRCVIAFLAFFMAASLSAAIPERERTALLAIYNGTNGPSWTDHTGWNGAAASECQWYGVVCDDAQSTVIRLELGSNGLTGSVPVAIGDLGNLTDLYLQDNSLTGSIPDSIGNLTKLRLLELEQNGFSGTIPPALGRLSSLTDLFLYDNRLGGSIPPELGSLAQLQRLGLSTNQLTGSIPSALGQLRNLQLLDLSANQLTGSIPAEIGNAAQLNELNLADNRLSGTIPVELYSLSNLQALNLEQNQISGALRAELAKLQNLQRLVLWGNQLTGAIPTQITTMTALQRLEISINQFSGAIPADIDRLQNLQTLELGENAFEGTIPAGIGNLRNLTVLILDRNKLTGTIPSGIANLTALEILILGENDFTGSFPDLRNLTNLRELFLGTTRLSGTIPDMFTQMSNLQIVYIDNTLASGSIPPSLTAATALTAVDLSYNQLTGSIPADINKLVNLQYLTLSYNPMSGPIPDGLWDLRELLDLRLAGLHLEGTLSPRVGNLTKLENLDVNENELTGVIPPQIGQLNALLYLTLGGNRFSGSVPPELARLTNLLQLDIYGNNLTGAMPPDLARMTSLIDGGSVFQYNALYTTDASLREFLNRKQYDHDWESTQTVVPANVRVTASTDRNATVEWTPISYQWDDGGYQVRAALSQGGNAVAIITTSSKEISSAIVRGLQPSTTYYVSVAAVTYPHDAQHNLLLSTFSDPVQMTTGPRVLAPADVVVTADPRGLVQIDGVPQNEDSFSVTNFGDTATTITLTKFDGDFFTLTPESFALAAAATQTITLKSVKQPVGTYWGWVDISGDGAQDLGVSTSLLSATRPPGTVIAEPLTTRVEITGVPGSDSVGTVSFRNTGTATLTGIAVSDVPWIVPRTDPITIDPSASGSVTFTVDRSRRPSATGALTGALSLIYVAGTSGSLLPPRADGTPPSYSISIVTVVDTAKPQVAPGTIPPIAAKEVAYFIPGLTSAQKSYGNVVSDVSLVNAFGSKAIDDLKMYFTPSASTQTATATVASIAGNQSMTMANIVTNVYASSNPIGSLQLRSGDWQKLVITAKQLCIGKSGTYSGDLPVFRSDRSAAAGGSIYLAGVRRGSTLQTTIYLQETSGASASVHIDYLNASGTTIAQRDATLGSFGSSELSGDAPDGAVTAVVTNASASAGRISAYARVVDDSTGDSWSIVDWTRYYDFLQTEPARIPLAQSGGSAKASRRRAVRHDVGATAANQTQTTTELTLFNPATSQSRVRIRYGIGGAAYEKDITLAARQTLSVSDAAGYAGAPSGNAATVLITPTRGSVVATSRIATASAAGSYSAGVPVVPAQSGLRVGQSQIFSGLDDSTSTTINAATAGTYRTSYGFIETSGAPVTVTATLLVSDGRSLVSTVVTKQVDLAAGQLIVISDMVRSIVGDTRDSKYPDLHNLQLQIDVTGGSGAVVPFVIVSDNATGDSLLRLE